MENMSTAKLPTPQIDPSAFIAKGAIVLGNVTVKENASIWYNSTLRSSTEDPIIIGEGSNIQDNSVVHVDSGYKVEIGKNVTVGHSSIIHGCIIGDNSLIGMGSTVMNGAVIGKNCIIGAGALITQNSIIPDNCLVLGAPGKVVRMLSNEDIRGNTHSALHYIEEAAVYKRMEEGLC